MARSSDRKKSIVENKTMDYQNPLENSILPIINSPKQSNANKKHLNNHTDEKNQKFNEFLNENLDLMIKQRKNPIKQYLQPIFDKSND